MTLQYSEINFDKNKSFQENSLSQENPTSLNKSLLNPPKLNEKSHNKTVKKSAEFNMSELFDKIHKKESNLDSINPSDNNDTILSDFKPLPDLDPTPMINSNTNKAKEFNLNREILQENINDYNKNYYKNTQYNGENLVQNNTELLNKLNYIITLLEEQKDEKTNNVLEEVILYSFLGIFIIFIIDSFAKASKYIR